MLEATLVEEALAALDFLAGLTLEGGQRARLVEGVASLVATLQRMLDVAEDDAWRSTLQRGIERGERLFGRLTSADFRARVLHWLGPSPLRAQRRIDPGLPRTEIVGQGKRLAREIMTNPSLFATDLQDWIADSDAQNAGYFLHALGELDRGQTWLRALEDRIDRARGVFALSDYVTGWHAAAPMHAEA
jgi:hypothetical protein